VDLSITRDASRWFTLQRHSQRGAEAPVVGDEAAAAADEAAFAGTEAAGAADCGVASEDESLSESVSGASPS